MSKTFILILAIVLSGCSKNGTLPTDFPKIETHPIPLNINADIMEDSPETLTLQYSDPKNKKALACELNNHQQVNNINPCGCIQGQCTVNISGHNNYSGDASFNFRVQNEEGRWSDWGKANLKVWPTNDLPVSQNYTFNGIKNNQLAQVLVAQDVDSNNLTFLKSSDTSNGILVLNNNGSFTYNPNNNYVGGDSFTFIVNDGEDDSSVYTVNILITHQNTLPVAVDSVIYIQEDSVVQNYNLNASDSDGNSLTYILVSSPSKGNLNIINLNTGFFSYVPNLNSTGVDSFTFKVNDGISDSNIATVSVNIAPVNDAPVAYSANLSVSEDSSINSSLTGEDVDSTSLTYSIATIPSKGIVNITNAATGAYTYIPNDNAIGADSFTFQISDGFLNSNIATISININGINDAPISFSGNFTTNEDVVHHGNLIATDLENSSLTYSLENNPSKGLISLNSTTGAFTYTPNANTNGSDSFTFKVNDGALNSNISTISIVINPVNDIPIAFDDNIVTNRNIGKNFTLVGFDEENSPINFTITANPANGVLTGTPPNMIYTPNNNYVGADSFSFKVNDGTHDSVAATINILVNNSNNLPVSQNLSFSVDEDSSSNGTLNATDADNDSLIYAIVSNAGKGVVVINNPATGSFTYTPNGNSNGADSFNFKTQDPYGDSNIATVSIMINSINDLPTTTGNSYATDQNMAINISLAVVEVDGDILSYTISNPSRGVISGTPPNIIYTPNLNEKGSDSFNFKVNDGSGDSNFSTINITINDTKNWYNSNWGYRRRILINNQNQGTLNNFPVLVKLNSSKIDYAKFKSNGQDIRFTDSVGNILSYEVERWNNLGDSFIWVKVPAIAANSTTEYIWMYYGNANANSGENISDVWSNNYVGVYHLEETTGLSKNSVDGTLASEVSSGITRNISGAVGGGEGFDNDAYKINTGSAFSLNSQLSVEAWVYPTSSSANQKVLIKNNNSSLDYGLYINNGKAKLQIASNTLESAVSLSSNSWSYIAANFQNSNDTFSLQVNGINYNSSTNCNHNLVTENLPVYLAGDEYNTNGFKGVMDEIRISSVIRSQDWIAAQFLSMKDNYLWISSEQTFGGTVINQMLLTIKSNIDDGEVDANGIMDNNSSENRQGQSNTLILLPNNHWGYYRFQLNTNIPAGANISNTRLRLYGTGSSNWTSTSDYLGIRGEQSLNASAISSNGIVPLSGVAVTTASSSWGAPGLNWNVGDWNISSNISSIIQELLTDYSGLSSNNYIQLWVSRGTSLGGVNLVKSEDFSNTGLNQAQLYIEWTE